MAPNRDDSNRTPLRAWRQHAKILLACLRDSTGSEARALVRSAPADTLLTLPASAALHRVVGPVHAALRESLPAEAAAALDALYREESARHLLVIANLRRVQELLRDHVVKCRDERRGDELRRYECRDAAPLVARVDVYELRVRPAH